MPSDLALIARVLVGAVLGHVIGFERALRGALAGDRTFGLVAVAATAVTGVAFHASPQAIAGLVTGIGFIGASVVFRAETTLVRGITTAAAIFATAALGIVVGAGHILLGAVTAAVVLLILELPYTPLARRLDSRRYVKRFRNDSEPPRE